MLIDFFSSGNKRSSVKISLSKEYIHVNIVGRESIIPYQLPVFLYPEKILKNIQKSFSVVNFTKALRRNYHAIEHKWCRSLFQLFLYKRFQILWHKNLLNAKKGAASFLHWGQKLLPIAVNIFFNFNLWTTCPELTVIYYGLHPWQPLDNLSKALSKCNRNDYSDQSYYASPNHVDNNKSSYNSTYDTVKSYNSNTAGNPIIMRDKP